MSQEESQESLNSLDTDEGDEEGGREMQDKNGVGSGNEDGEEQGETQDENENEDE